MTKKKRTSPLLILGLVIAAVFLILVFNSETDEPGETTNRFIHITTSPSAGFSDTTEAYFADIPGAYSTYATEPVTEPEPPTEVWQSGFALRTRDLGACAKLKGDTFLILVFVSTPEHPWTQDKKDRAIRDCQSAAQFLETQAADYGVSLQVQIGTLECSTPYESSYSPQVDLTWYYDILHNFFKTESISQTYAGYRVSLDKDSTPIIFVFNSDDRSYAETCNRAYPNWNEEFVSYYVDGHILAESEYSYNAYSHEILHLFGAIDMYDLNNEGIQTVAERYFPNSVMIYYNRNEIDPATAYLVGWMDEPTPEAKAFFTETLGMRK